MKRILYCEKFSQDTVFQSLSESAYFYWKYNDHIMIFFFC